MPGDLIPTTGGFIERKESRRRVSRQLAGLDRSKTVGLAKLEGQAELEAAKAHAVGYVGQQAMQAVTMLSQLEGQLGQACPMAVSRLQGIADMTSLGIAQVVADSARKLGG